VYGRHFSSSKEYIAVRSQKYWTTDRMRAERESIISLERKYHTRSVVVPEDPEIDESESDLKNDEWFKDNYIDLMQEHPREWIAVIDQKIIAVSSNEVEIKILAEQIAGDREYSLYYVAPTAMVTDSGYSKK
jgi:hypothetical protein